MMPHLKSSAVVVFCVAATITLVGCGDAPPSGQSAQDSSQHRDPKADTAVDDAKHSQDYVTCRATLSVYEKDHSWFEDSSFGHDDGKAPLASFVLAEPATYADRALGILFKDSETAASSSPDQTDIGSEFTFQIPEDFLKGTHKTIANRNVRHFRKSKT